MSDPQEKPVPADGATVAANNRRLLVKLTLVVVGMFAFALFVMPPLYDAFCEITGLNGKGSSTADVAPVREDDSRMVNVEFLADTDPGLPWEFRKGVPSVQVHPGKITKTTFFVKNLDGKAVTGRAVPSISPGEAAQYFKKTECFCFREQRLDGGEEKEMPMIFYVDPALPRHITTITLSYKYYNMNKP